MCVHVLHVVCHYSQSATNPREPFIFTPRCPGFPSHEGTNQKRKVQDEDLLWAVGRRLYFLLIILIVLIALIEQETDTVPQTGTGQSRWGWSKYSKIFEREFLASPDRDQTV
jgi:hypothetical protein